jgi:hypothetical protein
VVTIMNDDPLLDLQQRFETVTCDRPLSDVYDRVRSRKRRRHQRVGIGATVVVAVALVTVFVVFPAGDTGIAGWTPDPHPADPATVALADPVCREALSRMYPNLGPAEWTDMRGNGLVMVYANQPGTLLVCQFVVDEQGGFPLGGGAGPIYMTPLIGTVQVDGISWSDGEFGGTTVVVGQASPGVARVMVSAPGWMATASRHDGYWLAWWPAPISDESDILVAAFDMGGEQIGSWVAP